MCVCHMCAFGVFPSIITDVVVDKYTSTERACLKMLKIARSFYVSNLYEAFLEGLPYVRGLWENVL